MKYLLSFLAGVMVGSAAALLFAPISGEELRTELQTRTDAELKKANAEMRRALADLSERFEDTHRDVQRLVEQTRTSNRG